MPQEKVVPKAPAFDKAMEFVFAWEGGYVNHPSDPGGETKYGISKRAYPKLDIRKLTPAAAKAIYHKDYWLAAGCDKMLWPECLVVMDTAVNMGVGRAKQFLERVGPSAHKLLLEREMYYENLATRAQYAPFRKGWMNRLKALRVAAEFKLA